ncbi:uncharacterized protein A1O9_10710 [Exophiala aquamarina CBS 119918]|uniref:Cupin 2 conserved barrel domain-containing protein n=1 Tax=Exophiala aquamarina CBS 119918 TaxID=1182545 RepID=A0A072P0T3_9EURO|nr:uncharacterized protein A1O9_10710 [Exophiala aquamarina CBS 119918]KEF53262.1 hypothetical protein A1O9_10710 [Exophiala aquamarina CBS 119918]
MAWTRRKTTQLQSFERGGASAVTYDLSQPHRITITIPNNSTWTSGPHWHETHDEYLQILQGRASVRVGSQVRELGPENGIVEAPRYTVHEWRRAVKPNSETLVVREWTAPEDGQKEGFFRMLNSFLTEPQAALLYQAPFAMPVWAERWIEGWIVPLQLFIVFQAWDNWPVLYGDDSGWISWTATHFTLWVSSWAGSVLGLHGSYNQYIDKGALMRGSHHSRENKKTPP